ncbi:MAG TPA: hypothetical protein VLC06_14560, partial [Polyangia bacterium]|nr:hypothetical protein [Polyangia bacterium]
SPTVGHPVVWCRAGWGKNGALLKIDAVVGRVSQVVQALPDQGQAALIAPSKLAVVSGHRMGVVDLETRKGAWLILPGAGGSTDSDEGIGAEDLEPVQGGVATLANAHDGQEATLTVYAAP